MVPSTVQAGGHEDLTTSFDFGHDGAGHTYNDVRSTVVSLPAGLVGSAAAVPTCPTADLLSQHGATSECPVDTQVGTISFDLTFEKVPVRATFGVFNMEVTTPGVAAELGFNAFILSEVLPVRVRPGDTGLTVTAPDIENVGEAHAVSVTIWGVPGAHEHDAERGMSCIPEPLTALVATCKGGGKSVSTPARPFLSMPTACPGVPLEATLEADSWEEPSVWSKASTTLGPVTGCERVPFQPAIEATPTTSLAESPSGLDLSLVVPQSWEKPEVTATSDLKDTVVTLPEGYTVNPSAGSGLLGCTPEQFAAETASNAPGAGCPEQSKIGTVEAQTPLLDEDAKGAVYIASPYNNPFASLLAMYIVLKIPQRGVIVKVAGEVSPDPVTGRLTTVFDDNPQVPFSRLTLRLRQGATSPLVSPPLCGPYTIHASLTPWSAPLEPRLLESSFAITQGVHGGACPTGATPPLHPSVISGSTNNNAGAYSPFYLRIYREDGEQELTRFSTIMPPGLTGNLTGIPFCPDAAIEAARHATGTGELEHPSCPAASEIGRTLVGAGVGGTLAWTPGKVYLAGPYNGVGLSLVSITSATVGPFDLGTVVIRFALRINPVTSQVEIDPAASDQIPHIIDGIVVHVRDIRAYIDRPNFMLNPTSCAPMKIQNTITGTSLPATITTPYQAADCRALAFKPKFEVTVTGKTSKQNGAGMTVHLTYPKAPLGTQTNIHAVKVELPIQLPSRLTTLQKACPEDTYNQNPAACPTTSIVGHATATTPILPVPLTGPAYFVSHGSKKFPELVILLQGYGITIQLNGETHISHKGITTSTFHALPDQPVNTFTLTLPQGPNSALAANGNLCKPTLKKTIHKTTTRRIHGHTHRIHKTIHKTIHLKHLHIPTTITAQNGTTTHKNTTITITGCTKHHKKHKKRKHKRKRAKHHG